MLGDEYEGYMLLPSRSRLRSRYPKNTTTSNAHTVERVVALDYEYQWRCVYQPLFSATVYLHTLETQ